MPIWFLPKVSDGCTWQAHAFSKRRSYHSDEVFFSTTLFFFFIVPRNVYSKINWRVSVHTLKLAQCTWSRLENVVETIISRMSFESWPRLDKCCRQWCSSVCENCDGWNVRLFPLCFTPFFKKGGGGPNSLFARRWNMDHQEWQCCFSLQPTITITTSTTNLCHHHHHTRVWIVLIKSSITPLLLLLPTLLSTSIT